MGFLLFVTNKITSHIFSASFLPTGNSHVGITAVGISLIQSHAIKLGIPALTQTPP